MSGKRLVLGAIVDTINAWRHPGFHPQDVVTVDYYRKLIETAERGCFDLMFWGDSHTLASDGHGNVVEGSNVTRCLDPVSIIGALSSDIGRQIGLAATLNLSYWKPEVLARKIASLQLLSAGRMAWNVVAATTVRDDQNIRSFWPANNQAERYKAIDECLAVMDRCWRQELDVYASEVLVGHGDFRPLIIQAGQSPEFQAQAARTADAVFTKFQSLDEGQAFYANVKNQMKRAGRNPDSLKIMPGLRPILAPTIAQAREKQDYLEGLTDAATAIDGLSRFSGLSLSEYDPDGPLPPESDIPLAVLSRDERVWWKRLREIAEYHNYSIVQLARTLANTLGHISYVGTPSGLADLMQRWLDNNGCDGFNILFPCLPDGLSDFVGMGVPALQERGIFQKHYAPGTLREKLGLVRPVA